ncbi:hypothetical protein [Nocardioides pelophilus]|uniref:hypothetical protein n=1 Tax=Nocardioides pelophilus TaxID=2172019 RepID=UPI0015FF9FCF|nr:hypothetical protein [Nocardioides pelophilus]
MKRGTAAAVAVLLPAVLAGCASDDGDGAEEPGAESTELPRSDEPRELDPADLGPDVTNPWFPLEPGVQWVYRETDEDGEVLEVVVTATSETRMIANGVEARVVRDTVTLDGEIIEDTLDWYAQDENGTVWYLGEDTAEFEDGELVSHEGSFEAGVDEALAGVIMPADPMPGDSYRQEYSEGVAEDNGEVLALDGTASVPAGTYDDLLQTADTNALEPGVLEHKFYAEDVGLVLTVDVNGGGREELVSVSTVPAAQARRAGQAPLGSPD